MDIRLQARNLELKVDPKLKKIFLGVQVEIRANKKTKSGMLVIDLPPEHAIGIGKELINSGAQFIDKAKLAEIFKIKVDAPNSESKQESPNGEGSEIVDKAATNPEVQDNKESGGSPTN